MGEAVHIAPGPPWAQVAMMTYHRLAGFIFFLFDDNLFVGSMVNND